MASASSLANAQGVRNIEARLASGSRLPVVAKVCYNLQAMWSWIQGAAYVCLVLGYVLLLLLAIRHRIRRGGAQRLLETALFGSALWTVSLGLLALLTSGTWWAFAWHRTTQVGVVMLALLTAEFADAFLQRKGNRWLRLALVLIITLDALALDALPIPFPKKTSRRYLLSTLAARSLLPYF
jgi:hypothetical protein